MTYKLQTFKFRVMAEYWIATQKIPIGIQFNTTVMILHKEGNTWFPSFKLTEEECKDPEVIWDHFVKFMGSASTY